MKDNTEIPHSKKSIRLRFSQYLQNRKCLKLYVLKPLSEIIFIKQLKIDKARLYFEAQNQIITEEKNLEDLDNLIKKYKKPKHILVSKRNNRNNQIKLIRKWLSQHQPGDQSIIDLSNYLTCSFRHSFTKIKLFTLSILPGIFNYIAFSSLSSRYKYKYCSKNTILMFSLLIIASINYKIANLYTSQCLLSYLSSQNQVSKHLYTQFQYLFYYFFDFDRCNCPNHPLLLKIKSMRID